MESEGFQLVEIKINSLRHLIRQIRNPDPASKIGFSNPHKNRLKLQEYHVKKITLLFNTHNQLTKKKKKIIEN